MSKVTRKLQIMSKATDKCRKLQINVESYRNVTDKCRKLQINVESYR
jgi:hypothetical protein